MKSTGPSAAPAAGEGGLSRGLGSFSRTMCSVIRIANGMYRGGRVKMAALPVGMEKASECGLYVGRVEGAAGGAARRTTVITTLHYLSHAAASMVVLLAAALSTQQRVCCNHNCSRT